MIELTGTRMQEIPPLSWDSVGHFSSPLCQGLLGREVNPTPFPSISVQAQNKTRDLPCQSVQLCACATQQDAATIDTIDYVTYIIYDE